MPRGHKGTKCMKLNRKVKRKVEPYRESMAGRLPLNAEGTNLKYPKETIIPLIAGTCGLTNAICKRLKIAPATFYIWRDKYDWFRDEVLKAKMELGDMAEDSLRVNIRKKREASTIFALKCLKAYGDGMGTNMMQPRCIPVALTV